MAIKKSLKENLKISIKAAIATVLAMTLFLVSVTSVNALGRTIPSETVQETNLQALYLNLAWVEKQALDNLTQNGYSSSTSNVYIAELGAKIEAKRDTLINGVGDQLAEYAKKFVGEDHTRFTSYRSKNSQAYEADWCAMFVSYCCDCLGYIDLGIIPCWFNAAGETGWNIFKTANKWKEPNGYTPVKNDIIFFSKGHVGIVTDVTSTTISTVEGNSGASSTSPYWKGSHVVEGSYSLNDSGIQGYVSIGTEAAGAGIVQSERTKEPTQNDKWYSTANPFPSMLNKGKNKGSTEAYGWGRFYEAHNIKLPVDGTANNWISQLREIDSTWITDSPTAGCLLMWYDANSVGVGQVAFCEKVNDNGTIVITESGKTYRWRTQTVSSSNNWGHSDLKFLGCVKSDAAKNYYG